MVRFFLQPVNIMATALLLVESIREYSAHLRLFDFRNPYFAVAPEAL